VASIPRSSAPPRPIPAPDRFSGGAEVDCTQWRIDPHHPDEIYWVTDPWVRAKRNPRGVYDIFGWGTPKDPKTPAAAPGQSSSAPKGSAPDPIEFHLNKLHRGYHVPLEGRQAQVRDMAPDPTRIKNYIDAFKARTPDGHPVVPRVHRVYVPQTCLD